MSQSLIRAFAIFIGALFMALPPTIAFAEAGTIFRIRAGGCTLEPMNRALAGFMVEGGEGIITALHGVADCAEITAESFSPKGVIVVKIANEDKRLDAARLVPADAGETAKLLILKPSLIMFKKLQPMAVPAKGVAVTALGFEGGVLSVQTNTRLAIGNPPRERLGDILGSKNQDIVERKSPSIDLSVIKLEGTVNKGESGGPVIVPSKADAIIGMVLGSPDPGASNLAWVAPINEIAWAPFEASFWKTQQVPKALADAVGYDGPRMTFRLQLAHDKQRPTVIKKFPVTFETANGGANTVHSAPFFADYGTTFENPVVEVTESVGLTRQDVSIQNRGRLASLNLSFTPTGNSPRVSFKGTVTLQQVKDIPAFQSSAMVDFSLRKNGAPIGERTVEVKTEGVWETFKLLDQSNREFASGRVSEPVSDSDGGITKVMLTDSKVTISVVPEQSKPMPPPTITVK